MSYSNRLFFKGDIYNTDKTDLLFAKAVQENINHHIKHCSEYADILKARGFTPDTIQSAQDLHKIPALTTLFLKKHNLFSSDENKLIFKSTTSGTSGSVSVSGFDIPSLWRSVGMFAAVFLRHKILSPIPTNYIVLGYQPAKRNKMGVVKTAYGMTLCAPAMHREYALVDNGKEYELNINGIKNALIRYEKQGLPVRFMGFPPYFMFLLDALEQDGIKLKLHPKSRITLAGGWKQFFTQRIEKPELYKKSEELLGIGADKVWEFFGAVEHPILYLACEHGHFHVPIYSRVIIRDPATLEPMPYGGRGLINLITPLLTSMPFTSVITDDLGIMYPPGQCGCGRQSAAFDILGRVGMAEIKTCSAGAAELLSGAGKKEGGA